MVLVTVGDLLHWAYARELVHKARAPGMDGGAGFAPRGFAQVASSERIGAAVGSSMNLGFEAPRDAYAVMAAVNACGQAKLVREYALTGAAPDWTPHPEIWWEKGDPIYAPSRRQRVIGYAVALRGDYPALVDERRACYQRWAMAVGRVHGLLAVPGVLVAHTLAADRPALAPWN